MSFSISYNFIAKDKFSGVTKAMKRGLDKVNQAARKANQLNKKVAASVLKMGAATRSFGNKVSGMGRKLFTGMTLPIIGLGIAVLGAAGKIEKIETGFIGMLGSIKKAKAVVKDLTEFTAKTPFQLGDVAGAAQQLLAALVPVDKIKARLQTLGNIAAAANIPLKDMSAIFSKARNKGKAMTEELLQLSDRGIPIIDILSRGLGVTKNKVFELASQSKISFAIFSKALIQMTRKGEFANRAMVLQSKTLFGVISTLKDNIILTSAAIGDIFLPQAKKFALSMIDTASGVKSWVLQNKSLVKTLAIVLSILASIGPILITIGILSKAAGFAMVGFGIALKGAAIAGSILTGIFKIIGVVAAVASSSVLGIAAAIAGVIFLVLKLTGVWDSMIAKLRDVGPLRLLRKGFEAVKGSIGSAIGKLGNLVGLGSNINVNSRQQIDSGAASPVGGTGQNNRFQGNMSIAIADKGKNVESVRFSSLGDLNLGVSGVGI